MTERRVELFSSLRGLPGALPASYSRMSALERCPFSWNERYVKRHRAPKQAVSDTAIEVGSIMHETLESCMHTAIKRGNVTANDYAAVLNGKARLSSKEVIDGCRDAARPTYKVLRELVKECGFKFPEHKFSYGFDGMFKAGAWDFRKSAFIGIADLVVVQGPVARVIDYKTEHVSEIRKAMAAEQTSLYSEAVFDEFPRVETVHCEVIYLLDRQTDRLSTETRDNLRDLQDRNDEVFSAYLTRVREKSLEARKTPFCQWCEYLSTCCPLFGEYASGSDTE